MYCTVRSKGGLIMTQQNRRLWDSLKGQGVSEGDEQGKRGHVTYIDMYEVRS